MNDFLVIAPILLPLVTLIVCLMLEMWGKDARVVSFSSVVATLGVATLLVARVNGGGALTMEMGGWRPPYGIVIVADLLAALMIWISAFVVLVVMIYGLGGRLAEQKGGHVHVLVQGLLLGVSGSFLTGDLFNLYVWFEVMLISSFVLMVREKGRKQLEGGLIYVILNLVASAMFLCGAGLLYGKLGTLNFADMAMKLQGVNDPEFVNTTGSLLFVAFAAKAGLFPFYFWLPASYHRAGPAVSALFAGLLTKVGVYALLRTFTLVFTDANGFSNGIILTISMATMVIGVLGAVAQYHVRRLLAFHIISQIGYMVAGIAIGTRLALAAVIFYTLHHIAVKTCLFLVAGVLEMRTGTPDIRRHGGFYRSDPLLAVCFLIAALSLGGIPPLSGFWAKLNLLQAGVETGEWLFLFIALAVGILTLFSMVKIWNESFWKDKPEGGCGSLPLWPGRPYAAIIMLCLLTLVFSFCGKFVFELSENAAAALHDPRIYIEAVMGGGTE
ncbi:Na+/H+ antiporter subunit D [Akkermansiaceae bacterium]|nr:Na+/H+ antiporter subunit D [Akkermansiaceae bacterium]